MIDKICKNCQNDFKSRLSKRKYSSWRRKRLTVAKKFGWKVLFFDQSQLRDSFVTKKLQSLQG